MDLILTVFLSYNVRSKCIRPLQLIKNKNNKDACGVYLIFTSFKVREDLLCYLTKKSTLDEIILFKENLPKPTLTTRVIL
jgi:hypothetical protein